LKTDLDRARDELFSHIQRCDVLEAGKEEQQAWLDDTMGYMFECYPQLSPVERTQLGVIAERYLRPTVPHGKGKTARNRDEWQEPSTD
jgi:hypothetical protein